MGTKTYYITKVEIEDLEVLSAFLLDGSGYDESVPKETLQYGAFDENRKCLGAIRIELHDLDASHPNGWKRAVLSSLYVQEDCRRQGIGSALLEQAAQELEHLPVRLIQAYYMDTRQGISGFFERNDFQLRKLHEEYRISVPAILDQAMRNPKLKQLEQHNCTYMDEAGIDGRQSLQEFFSRNHIERYSKGSLFSNRKYSMYYCHPDDPARIKSLMLCSRSRNILLLDLLFSEGKTDLSFLNLFSALLARIKTDPMPPREVVFLAVNESTYPLAVSLFGNENVRNSGCSMVASVSID